MQRSRDRESSWRKARRAAAAMMIGWGLGEGLFWGGRSANCRSTARPDRVAAAGRGTFLGNYQPTATTHHHSSMAFSGQTFFFASIHRLGIRNIHF